MYTVSASLLANMILISDYALAFNKHNILVQKKIGPLLEKYSPGMTLEKLVGGVVADETKKILQHQKQLKTTLSKLDGSINFKSEPGQTVCQYLNSFANEDTSPKTSFSIDEYNDFIELFMFLTKQMAERFVLCQVDMRCKLHFDRKLPKQTEQTMKWVWGKMPTGNADSSQRKLKLFFEAAEHPDIKNMCYQVYKEATKGYFVDF
jgi:hypothetical protein